MNGADWIKMVIKMVWKPFLFLSVLQLYFQVLRG